MSKSFERVSAFIIVVLAIFGAFVTSLIVHELIHQEDYKIINPFNDYICALVLPGNSNLSDKLAYYSFNYNHTNETEKEVIKIKEYSEKKADMYDATVLIILMAIILYFIFYRWLVKPKDLNSLNDLNIKQGSQHGKAN